MTTKAFRAGKRAPNTVFELSDVSALAGLNGDYDGQQVSLAGWHPNSTVGGGALVWNPTRAKSNHNGGTVLSPTVPWTTTTADYLNGVGETDPAGLGVWESLEKGYVTPEMFGAVGDGAEEDFPAWNALVSLQKSLLVKSELENPSYLVTGQVLFTNSLHLDMPTATIIKPVGDFDVKGAISTLPSTLAADVFAGDHDVIVSNGADFAAGDLIIIQNADPFSFSGHRAEYQDGEFIRVFSVSANTVTFETALKSNYLTTSAIQFHKLETVEFSASGVTFTGSGSDNLLGLDIVENVDVENIKVIGGTNRAFGLRRCYGGSIKNGNYEHREPESGTNYGISFANCQDIDVYSVQAFGTRHAIATGGYSNAGAVVCRNINIYTSTLGSSVSHSADIHGNAVDCYYHDCNIGGGSGIGGKRCGIKGGEVYPNPLGTSPTLMLTEIAGEIEFSDLVAYAPKTIEVLAANSSSQMAAITNDFKIKFTNSTINLPTGYAPLSVTSLVNYADGALVNWDVFIDDITVKGDISSLNRFSNWAVSNSVGSFPTPPKSPVCLHLDRICFDDLSTLTYWIIGTGLIVDPLVTKYVTMPKVSGKVSATITNGSHSSPTYNVTYPEYPITAKPILSLSQTDVGFKGGTRYIAMGTAGVGSADIVTTTMHTSETVTVDSACDVYYKVGLDGYRP